MAANKQQGSYFGLFLDGATVLCAGFAYFDSGFGKVVLVLGAGVLSDQLVRIHGDQAARGKDGGEAREPGGMKLVGHRRGCGLDGSHRWPAFTLPTASAGDIIFALLGIGVSLVGIIGILPAAFGKSMAGKAEPVELCGSQNHNGAFTMKKILQK